MEVFDRIIAQPPALAHWVGVNITQLLLPSTPLRECSGHAFPRLSVKFYWVQAGIRKMNYGLS